jgi:general nucleoside transport system permease protein
LLPPAAFGLPLLVVAAALLGGFVLALPFSRGAGAVLDAAWDGAFGSPYAIGASLNRATVLALVGLGFCWAYRCRLVNVGGEGQIALGGIFAAALALHGGAAGWPSPLSWLVPVLGAALGGLLWGGIAGVMKARFGTNEVISTLMLSFVAAWLLYGVTHSEALLRQPMTSSTALPESLDIAPATRLPLLGSDGSPLHLGLLATLGSAAALWLVLERSVLGTTLRAVGLNDRAAAQHGMPARLHITLALAVAGAFGGLAGAAMVLGEQHNLKADFSSGYGFDGLVVGLLARGSPLAVLPYALFFGFLRSAGISLEIMARVPSSVVVLIQGLIVVLIAALAQGRPARMH